jgi:hypothetical protein
MQNATKNNQFAQAGLDAEQINTSITNLVNGLANQLASQLRPKMYARIRSVITGASAPSPVGFAATTPSTGSLLATLQAVPQTALTNGDLVNNVVTVFQGALISGHTASRVSGDFVSFQNTFNKTIEPMIDNLSGTTDTTVAQNPQLESAIVSMVNSLGNQLSNDLGPGAQPAIRTLITGQSVPSGVSFTSGTPIAGSLLATLNSLPQQAVANWDLIAELVTVYARSSTSCQ